MTERPKTEDDIHDPFLTPTEIAERLKVDQDTVRRLFLNEPGSIVICFPKKRKRLYRTLRVPESVFRRVLARFSMTPSCAKTRPMSYAASR
jgi:hypothetical protein